MDAPQNLRSNHDGHTKLHRQESFEDPDLEIHEEPAVEDEADARSTYGSIFSGFWDNRGEFHYYGGEPETMR